MDGELVLAADTAVVLRGEVLGKPRDAEDARRMLAALSGAAHEVLTGVCLRRDAGGTAIELDAVVSTTRCASHRSAQPRSPGTSARAGRSTRPAPTRSRARAARSCSGWRSVSNVVGLPLAETAELLRRAGHPLPGTRPRRAGDRGGDRRRAPAGLRAELPAGVTLVAVSKTQPAAAIREAYAAGQRDFGENYAREWREKADALADLPDLRWHFIGGLQTNKVKYLAGRIAFVHTVDREELARGTSPLRPEGRRRTRLPRGEHRRRGVEGRLRPGACAGARRRDPGAPGGRARWRHGHPAAGGRPRPHFRTLRALREALGVRELSMG